MPVQPGEEVPGSAAADSQLPSSRTHRPWIVTISRRGCGPPNYVLPRWTFWPQKSHRLQRAGPRGKRILCFLLDWGTERSILAALRQFLSLGGPSVKLSPSAHVNTFCRDNLPADENWPALVFELPELQYPERINCASVMLDDAAATYGADRPCLLTPDETLTYGDLVARSNQVARVLTEDFGIVPGQRVLLRGPNNPWLVACWFGVVKAGCVAVTTMPLLRSFELAPLAGLTRPALLLCDHRFEADLAGAAPTCRW